MRKEFSVASKHLELYYLCHLWNQKKIVHNYFSYKEISIENFETMEVHKIIAVLFVVLLVAFSLFSLVTTLYCIFVNIQSHVKEPTTNLEGTVCIKQSSYRMSQLTRVTAESEDENFVATLVP